MRALNDRRITVLSFDLLPRISRAQYMDALSSQATVSGYRAALAGAHYFDRFFPLLTTAAGTIRPAKVLVMGVGVAGLQAISTSKRLGAKVRAYDVRSAAKEEAESAGAVFVKLAVTADAAGGYARELTEEERLAQQAALLSEVANSDVVITTAAVPGRKSPILVTEAMVDAMGEGSIIIDMAADGGGNCELTKVGEVIDRKGVRIVGMSNPPSEMGASASFMYANNVLKLLALFGTNGQLATDWNDEVVIGVTVARDGADQSRADRRGARPRARGDHARREGDRLMGNVLLQYLTVLILTAFVGTEIIAKVPSILHTPLMSGSNAIHGVILVGSMLILGGATTNLQEVLGFLAVILATLNVVGGFVVTDRMLEMFKPRAKPTAPTSDEVTT